MSRTRRYAILGGLLGLAAAMAALGVVSLNPAMVLPAAWRADKVARSGGETLGRVARRPVAVSGARLERRSPGSAVERWILTTAGGAEVPVIVVGGTRVAGLAPPMAGEGKRHEHRRRAAAPDELKTGMADTSGRPSIEGDGPVAVEYFSFRCPACLRLAPAWRRFIERARARLFAKPLVAPGDHAAARALAVLRAAEALGPDVWWGTREMLQAALVAGMDEKDLDSFLAAAGAIVSPKVRAALNARPTPAVLAEGARLRKEADRVGVTRVPTWIVDGKPVPPGPGFADRLRKATERKEKE